MIKLDRGEKPEELTDEACEELKKLYAEDKDKDVWNSSKIKEPLKKAMLKMSHGKCSYCECKLGIESKDVTIDHFLPKSKNPDKVIEWENLFLACLRCNRKKNNREENRLDLEKLEFHKQVYEGYRQVSLMFQNRFKVVNGEQSKEQVYEDTIKIINEAIKQKEIN